MRWLPLLILSSSPALAGVLDLRGVDIGTPCQSVPPGELALGAQPKFGADLMLQKGLLLFEDDSVAGQSTVILYGCAGSPAAVANYAITVSTADQSRAQSLYTKAKTVATARLGPADFDSGKLKAGDRKQFLSIAGGPQSLASWQNVSGYTVHVSLQQPQTAGQWSVVTSVAPAEPSGDSAH
ncbi:MAG TPA: hypothetical protein VF848_06190 [Steroidobacteraceae bacterium]